MELKAPPLAIGLPEVVTASGGSKKEGGLFTAIEAGRPQPSRTLHGFLQKAKEIRLGSPSISSKIQKNYKGNTNWDSINVSKYKRNTKDISQILHNTKEVQR